MKKQFRLKQNTRIEEVVKKRKSVGNKYYVIYKGDEVENHKIAISVSKKCGNAVMRNKYKRQIRSILRNFNFVNHEILIVVKLNSKELNFQEKHKQIGYLLKKHNLIRR